MTVHCRRSSLFEEPSDSSLLLRILVVIRKNYCRQGFRVDISATLTKYSQKQRISRLHSVDFFKKWTSSMVDVLKKSNPLNEARIYSSFVGVHHQTMPARGLLLSCASGQPLQPSTGTWEQWGSAGGLHHCKWPLCWQTYTVSKVSWLPEPPPSESHCKSTRKSPGGLMA